jgi:hypothetical protein
MKANVFRGVDKFGIEEVPRPRPRSRRSRHSRVTHHHLRD